MTNWQKQLHIAMEECRPADWYYKFISSLLEAQEEEIRTQLLRKIVKVIDKWGDCSCCFLEDQLKEKLKEI